MTTAPPGSGPVVLRMLLGRHLRRLREAAGISRESAGDRIRGSESKISRMELGQVSFKLRDVTDLLTMYGVPDGEEHESLVDLARRARAAGWWRRYGDVLPSWFQTFVGMEDAATQIKTYELQFVPGLLQTPDYARAIVSGQPGVYDDLDRRVKVRMERQRILNRADPPELVAVLDETVVRRPVGGSAVMRGQLEHLLTVARCANVCLRILPFSIGAHSAESGAFTLLGFGQPELPDVVYVEQLTTALYLDKSEDVQHHVRVMEQLEVQAGDPADATALIQKLLAEL